MSPRWAVLWAALLLLSGCASAPEAEPGSSEPIQWRDWGREAFAEAERENKPILVNVGTQWCHWCHVMNETTYADPQVRGLVKRAFVAIRADAEERPELGERYFNEGWPANLVLSSAGQRMISRPGFQDVKTFLPTLRQAVADHAAGRVAPRVAAPAGTGKSLTELRGRVTQEMDAYYDERAGGWGRVKVKFPWTGGLEQLLERSWRRPGAKLHEARALRTLGEIEALIDPAWGGVFQYSDDGAWASPHYERVMHVQAGLVECYALAYGRTGNTRWLRDAQAIARHLRQILRDPATGAFWASQDADAPSDALDAKGERLSARAYFALDAAGRARFSGRPRIDRHLYAEHNGRAVAALARLYMSYPADPGPLKDARHAAEWLLSNLATKEDTTLVFRRSASPDPLLHLTDQVEVARGFMWLAAATGEAKWLSAAKATARGLARFEDPEGGFFAHTDDPSLAGPLAVRRKPFVINGRAAKLLVLLAGLAGEESWRRSAERALLAVVSEAEVKARAGSLGECLLALDTALEPPPAITVVSKLEAPQTPDLLRAAWEASGGVAAVKRVDPGAPDVPPGRGVYMCTNTRCSKLVARPEEVEALTAAFVRR